MICNLTKIYNFFLKRKLYLGHSCIRVSLSVARWLKYNGPAIKGGCVTRRKHRAGSWYFSRKIVTVQGGYGALFAVHGTNFIEHYECRGTSLIRAGKLSPVTEVGKWALAQCRGTSCLGARNLSRCRILIACRCACPGAATITNLSWVQEQKQKV